MKKRFKRFKHIKKDTDKLYIKQNIQYHKNSLLAFFTLKSLELINSKFFFYSNYNKLLVYRNFSLFTKSNKNIQQLLVLKYRVADIPVENAP